MNWKCIKKKTEPGWCDVLSFKAYLQLKVKKPQVIY